MILSVEKYRHLAEVVLHAPNHVDVEAREESEDMYVSIDGAVEKVAKQLRRLTDKVHDHGKREKLGQLEAKTQTEEDRV